MGFTDRHIDKSGVRQFTFLQIGSLMTLGNKTGIYAQGTSYTVKHVLNAVKGSILTHMDGCMDVEAGSAEWAAALPKTGI